VHPHFASAMANPPFRPGGLDRSQSFEPARTYNSQHNNGLAPLMNSNASASMTSLSLADLPSPRAGEVPPALSPLDALALQGRLLAKRFEQADKTGRRLSRLAPLTIQNEFGNRPGFFSNLSSGVNSPDEAGPIFPQQPESSPRQQVSDKHRSFYPQFGGDEPYEQNVLTRNTMGTIEESSPPLMQPQGYFDIPRSRSPDATEARIGGLREATPVTPSAPAPTSRLYLSPQRQPSTDSLPRSQPRGNLLPPRSSSSLHSQRSPRMSPSVRSVPGDAGSDVEDMSLSGSYDSLRQNRALSPSSSFSRAHSPFTPVTGSAIPRSPSVSSEFSANGALPRPSYNFSRPISRQSTRPSIDHARPSMDAPSRQPSQESVYMRPSFDSQPIRQDSIESPNTSYATETVHTPVSMASEDFRRSGDWTNNPVPSYTYTKFNLPRGRPVDRRSVGIEDFFKSQITWDQPSSNQDRPPSPESPPRSFDAARVRQDVAAPRDASMDRGAPSLTSSNSTIRGRTAGGADTTAQQHCDIGLELHEAGELLKSTYHLRLAARAGLPEAMFWYGLACRHGWGMRENKAEALQWLRRSVDSGQLEVADDESSKHEEPADLAKKKKHRAQYAVAIYELGKCYMNGWGAAQDKALALRCYEIAGNWGDADALVEAGYCYAEAVGCKKDMKKAAKFYRQAESKGVSMIGNSWIYKDKYMDDGSTVPDSRSVRSGRSAKKDYSDKKSRDKSRTRTIFGRKKSNTASSS
jgi:TPR repeat protein